MINTFLIIYLIIAVILLIYLSIKLFLFQHRKIENLIVYDKDIYIKINGSTFFNIKRKMEEHLSSEKYDEDDEYVTTLGLKKIIYLTDTSEEAVKKTIDRIITGITVDYIDNQIKQLCNKEINTKNEPTEPNNIKNNKQ